MANIEGLTTTCTGVICLWIYLSQYSCGLSSQDSLKVPSTLLNKYQCMGKRNQIFTVCFVLNPTDPILFSFGSFFFWNFSLIKIKLPFKNKSYPSTFVVFSEVFYFAERTFGGFIDPSWALWPVSFSRKWTSNCGWANSTKEGIERTTEMKDSHQPLEVTAEMRNFRLLSEFSLFYVSRYFSHV